MYLTASSLASVMPLSFWKRLLGSQNSPPEHFEAPLSPVPFSIISTSAPSDLAVTAAQYLAAPLPTTTISVTWSHFVSLMTFVFES